MKNERVSITQTDKYHINTFIYLHLLKKALFIYEYLLFCRMGISTVHAKLYPRRPRPYYFHRYSWWEYQKLFWRCNVRAARCFLSRNQIFMFINIKRDFLNRNSFSSLFSRHGIIVNSSHTTHVYQFFLFFFFFVNHTNILRFQSCKCNTLVSFESRYNRYPNRLINIIYKYIVNTSRGIFCKIGGFVSSASQSEWNPKREVVV